MKKSMLFMSLAALLSVVSCMKDDEEKVTATDTADVVNESMAEAFFNDIDDMSLVAMEDGSSPSSGGRIAEDDRFCTALEIQEGSDFESGVVTIDFGTGCTDNKLNVRTGKIILTYSDGPVGETGFTVVVTFQNYTINGVKLEGTRTITRLASQSSIAHEITLVNGKATWPDNSFITRSSSFTREVYEGQSGLLIDLDGSAEGTNRRGRSYTMNIDETLVYSVNCSISLGIILPISGVKTFTSGGRQLTLDFGNGTCDTEITAQVGNIPPQTINVGS